MKYKHLVARSKQAADIAACSSCPRRQVGCVIIEPTRNVVIIDGYNGPPRGGDTLCGGETCLREQANIVSGIGQSNDVGCLHAEVGAICNAAFQGVSTANCWMLITIPPCMACAKMIQHCGIVRVLITEANYATDGCEYLEQHGVHVEYISKMDLSNLNLVYA